MEYTLRPYQQEASDAAVEFLTNPKTKGNGILVEPVAFGKSLVIADIANRLDGNVLVFQPSKELLEQNLRKYESYGNYAQVYSASLKRREIGKVTFATIGTAVGASKMFGEFKYCLADEVHEIFNRDTSIDKETGKQKEKASMYQRFFEDNNMKIVGLTATPFRNKRYNYPEKHTKACMLTRMRPKMFNHYLHVTQISEMKANGWFAELKYQQVDFDKSHLVINTTGGDYTEESIKVALKQNDVNGNIISTIKKLKGVRKHILVFVPFVEDARYIAQQAGGEYIHGGTKPDERERILNLFKKGEVPFVANVKVLGQGFDFEEIDCIIDGYPTMSMGLYYQRHGRACRVHPNKKDALILDFVGNYSKFGKVEDWEIKDGEDGWGVYSNGIILTNRDIAEIQGIKEKEKDPRETENREEKERILNNQTGKSKAKIVYISNEKLDTWVKVEKNGKISAVDPRLYERLKTLLYKDYDYLVQMYGSYITIYEGGETPSGIHLPEHEYQEMVKINPNLEELVNKFDLII